MKQGLAMGARALLYHFVALALCLLLGIGLFDSMRWLQITLNVALLIGLGLMLFSDGAVRGERACTMSATLERAAREGRSVDPAARASCFAKRVALIAYLIAALPLIITATVNLIAEPYYPPVIIAESAVTTETFETEEALQDALDAAQDARTDAPVNIPNVAARAAFTAIVTFYECFRTNPHGLNLLFLAYALVYPLPMIVGYLMGPVFRRRKLLEIERGKKQKMRKLRVNQKKATPKPPKMEV